MQLVQNLHLKQRAFAASNVFKKAFLETWVLETPHLHPT